MNKIIFSIFACAFLFVLSASDVFACTCTPLPKNITIKRQVKEAYAKSSLVFVGEVVEIVDVSDNFFVTVRFRVEKTWSNKEIQKEITVSTGRNDGMCGYSFEAGKKYLIYAFGDGNNLETNICTRTSTSESNKDIDFLNQIKKPEIISSPK